MRIEINSSKIKKYILMKLYFNKLENFKKMVDITKLNFMKRGQILGLI